jgi:hypothetical protein
MPSRKNQSVRSAIIAGILLCFTIASHAFGQFALVDQNRSLTANATGLDQGISGLFGTGPAIGTQSLNTNSKTTAGSYSNTLPAAKNDTVNDGTGDSATFSVTSSAQQNSVVSTALLSANSSVGGSAELTQLTGTPVFSADGYGQSIFNVDFTVGSPTPFSISGDITGNAIYHLGRLELIAANLTFSGSSSGSPLYNVSFAPTGYTIPGESFDDPVSFSTILQPGQTYTLNAQASVDSGRAGVGLSSVAPASAGFSFTAAVPEPTSLVLIPAGMLLLLRRRVRSYSHAG